MIKKYCLLSILSLCSFAIGVNAQNVAIKTNLLNWAFVGTPNIGAEYALNKNTTINLSVALNPWVLGDNAKMQHYLVIPEYRYWFTETFDGFHVGAHLIAGGFDVGAFSTSIGPIDIDELKDKYYVGSAYGVGVGAGYSFYISPRFNLELKAGVSLVRVDYKSYEADCRSTQRGDFISKDSFYAPLPIDLGVSFVYLFNTKR